ncbi:hypothetical protein [Oharaeibacter diazotrophicus]|uniref:General secretion pathway protein N n=1 Tax=Oharaeibacter diazotrophicus TaxID=1920512 RepID=A0A4R6R694_9HYPH|nr:hypothetical protein [Oharaeibacter diazotrophicus]TDP81450.1 hypothetical protein EDD54_4318 [Oharaeibacter diazotrophicus]BBE73688.1 hypothetical protein OHA_1_03302 [Pleomorphomonas sp. SM30]GLS75477.1 hypothetical protein GCM10007904_08120 [Oharaeibacter diazotrophicus]
MTPALRSGLLLAFLAAAPAVAQDVPSAEPVDVGTATDAAAAATAAGADRFLLNNLSTLSLESLDGFRDRPLFTASRRAPAPPAPEPEPQPQPEPEPEPAVAPDPPNIRLAGVLGKGEETIALVQDLGTGKTNPVRVGDAIEAWTVAAIDPTALHLAYEDQVSDYVLFEPGSSPASPAGGAPGAIDGMNDPDALPQFDASGNPVDPALNFDDPGAAGSNNPARHRDDGSVPGGGDVSPDGSGNLPPGFAPPPPGAPDTGGDGGGASNFGGSNFPIGQP